MVACSILFLFIEFLSAWFLKQYRQFVDTATYLFKVKAIFDRHYLLYLALKGGEAHLAGDEKKLKTLAEALTDEIKWPNDNHLTKADVAFAREALDSVSDLLKALKSNRKEKEKKDED
jgi:CRISPR/Cas system-associated endonuclease Cas3-HD